MKREFKPFNQPRASALIGRGVFLAAMAGAALLGAQPAPNQPPPAQPADAQARINKRGNCSIR